MGLIEIVRGRRCGDYLRDMWAIAAETRSSRNFPQSSCHEVILLPNADVGFQCPVKVAKTRVCEAPTYGWVAIDLRGRLSGSCERSPKLLSLI
jgi:hypothetical protein